MPTFSGRLFETLGIPGSISGGVSQIVVKHFSSGQFFDIFLKCSFYANLSWPGSLTPVAMRHLGSALDLAGSENGRY